jgi:hypothetical protein
LVQELEVAAAAIEYGDAEPDMRLAIDVLVNRPFNGIEEVKQKLATLLATHPWMARDEVTETVGRIASGNASARSKRRKVIAIADSVMAALAPHVACPPGCSQCCHMNTVIYEHEAVRLAEATGRKMVRLPFRPPRVVHAEGMKFNGTPRPFLVENRCSEYEDRPLACRTHHSLRDAVEACSMDLSAAEQVRPPMYDPDLLEGPYQAISLRHRPTEPCGNIGNSLQSDARLRSIVGLRAGGGITASDFHALPHFGIGGGAGGA